MAAFAAAHSANEVGKKPYKLLKPDVLEGGLGRDSVAYVFVFFGTIIICWFYKLNLPDQGQVTPQLKVRLSFLV